MLLSRKVVLRVMEDNTTCIGNVSKGYSQKFRHLARTQRTSLGFLHHVFHEMGEDHIGPIILQHHEGKTHKGDHFTKQVSLTDDFLAACGRIGIAAAAGG